MGVKYQQLVRDGTFLSRYMEMMNGQETPYAYDFWSACWLLSLAVGRHTIVARPRAPVFLNIYALLLGESGVTRKSSSIRIATSIARSFIGETNDGMALVESKATPDALEKMLDVQSKRTGHAHAAIAVSELVTFLGRGASSGMPGLLTDLYDSPSIRSSPGTLLRGPTHLSNVYISFLSASTPSWLIRAVNPDVVEGGFTSRCLFVVSDKRKRKVAWPSDDDTNVAEELKTRMLGIRALAEKRPKIALTASALRKFSRWYNERTQNRDPFRSSFEAREDTHVLRLAGLLSINDEAWQINDYHIGAAIKIISEIKAAGADLFISIVTPTGLARAIEKLRTILYEAGNDGISQNRLREKMRTVLSAERLRIALDIMHELDMVQRFSGVKTGDKAGRTATIWRATSHLMVTGVINRVLEEMAPNEED